MDNHSLILHVLGSSGGPVNTRTQGFLFQYGDEFFMVDGGAGLSVLPDLFKDQRLKENEIDSVSYLYQSTNHIDESNLGISVKASIKKFTAESLPICNLSKGNFINKFKGNNIIEKSMDLYSRTQNVFVTHPHLDHINELIINLPVLYGSGLSDLKKIIHGSTTTNSYIQEHLLNFKIWPDLTNPTPLNSKQPEVRFKDFAANESFTPVNGIEIIRMSLNHGECEIDDQLCTVESSCYLLLDKKKKHLHLIFGDCEWDDEKFPLLILKTRELHEKLKYKLKTVVIECSSINVDKRINLYGHMNPDSLCMTLNKFHHIFDGSQKINLCITHVKQTITTKDPREVIMQQVRETLSSNNLSMYFETSLLLNGISYQL